MWDHVIIFWGKNFYEIDRFCILTKSALQGERKCKGKYHQSSQAEVRGHSLKQKKMQAWPKLAGELMITMCLNLDGAWRNVNDLWGLMASAFIVGFSTGIMEICSISMINYGIWHKERSTWTSQRELQVRGKED